MKTQEITARGTTATAFMPDSADVDAVQVGGLAPSCFGRLALVTRIIYRKPGCYVGYVCALGAGDTVENGCGCSNSMKAGELMRTVGLSNALNSADCDRLEEEMRRA